MVNRAKPRQVSEVDTKPKTVRVTWTDMERGLVVAEAAKLWLNKTGHLGVGAMLINAQSIALPENRRMSTSLLYNTGRKRFRDEILSKVEDLRDKHVVEDSVGLATFAMRANKAEEARLAEKQLAEEHLSDMGQEPVPFSADRIMEETVSELATRFEKLLKVKLEDVYSRVLSEFRERDEAVEALDLLREKSVSALADKGLSKPVPLVKEKVGYLDNGHRKKDHQLVMKGLGDCYKFYFADSAVKARALLDCGVIVRSVHCSHNLYEAAKRAAPNALWIEEKSPNMANELLAERWLKKPASVD